MPIHPLAARLKTVALLCAGLVSGLIAQAAATNLPAGSRTIENSVVKIFSTVRYPDPYKPWTKDAPEEMTGSGVVIGKKRILTNAHVVNYANQVQIQANQAGDKISATVEFITVECHLRFGETYVLPRAQMLAATDEILTNNGVRSQGTPDTLAIWNAKPAK